MWLISWGGLGTVKQAAKSWLGQTTRLRAANRDYRQVPERYGQQQLGSAELRGVRESTKTHDGARATDGKS